MCTYADGATLALRNVKVFTVQLGALCLGAEGDPTPALAQPAGVHAVHLTLWKLLPIVDTLGRNYGGETRERMIRRIKPSTMCGSWCLTHERGTVQSGVRHIWQRLTQEFCFHDHVRDKTQNLITNVKADRRETFTTVYSELQIRKHPFIFRDWWKCLSEPNGAEVKGCREEWHSSDNEAKSVRRNFTGIYQVLKRRWALALSSKRKQ